MIRGTGRNLSLLLLLMVGIAWPGLAQEPVEAPEDAEDEGTYVETVDVTVVNLDVYVTDKKGEPITGLTRDDFEIFENGRPVAISNFFAVEDRQPVEAQPPAAVAEPEAPAIPGMPEEEQFALPDDQRLSLVIYVDNFNIRPFNRNRVFRRLRDFLIEKVSTHDQVMLVTYDRSLHMRHDFTSDPTLIASQLFELEELAAFGVHWDSERRDVLRDINDSDSLAAVSWRVRQFAESGYNDLSFSIGAIKEIVTSLAGMPGRKVMLYVSDGLQMLPGEDLYYALNRKFGDSTPLTEMRQFDASRRFQELTAHANSSGVTFYTIDAAGLRAAGGSNVDMSTAGEAGMASFVDSMYIQSLQSPLRMMADDTGGRAIINANDVGPDLDKVASDFSTYYSLGYTPSHGGTGRYYKINVKVKQKGMRVRHRNGYRDKPLTTRMSDTTRASLIYGYDFNPMGIVLRVGEPEFVEKDLFNVPVLVGIPLGEITLLPLEEAQEGKVKLYFGAIDDGGDMSEISEVPISIQIPNAELEEALGGYYPYQIQLRMRSGPHRLTVGLWDQLGAEESFASKSVRVGS